MHLAQNRDIKETNHLYAVGDLLLHYDHLTFSLVSNRPRAPFTTIHLEK